MDIDTRTQYDDEMDDNVAGGDDDTSTLHTPGDKSNLKSKAGKVVNYLEGRHFPRTVLKYNASDGEIILMNPSTRADLEFYLLQYDVDKLQAVGDGLASVSEIIKGGFSGGFSVKKHGWKKVLQKISLILLTVVLLLGLLFMAFAVISILVVTIMAQKAPPSFQKLKEAMFYYLAYALILLIFFGTLVIMYNMITARMFQISSASSAV